MNFTYRIYPDALQQAQMLDWLESCRRLYNYALRELKDWMNSRKCMIDRCSKESPIVGNQIKLPKIGLVPITLHRGRLRKACVDASFGAFLSVLQWVCWKRGVYFERVNLNGTSQTCPNCQTAVSKTLGYRVHSCPECGYSTHRDHAAAQMVLIRGLENVVPVDDGERKLPGLAVLSGAISPDKWLSRNAQERS